MLLISFGVTQERVVLRTEEQLQGEWVGQCITHTLSCSPLRTVLRALEETHFVKHLILFFIMLTDRVTLAFCLVRRNESLGVSIKPGLIESEMAHSEIAQSVTKATCSAVVVCLRPVSCRLPVPGIEILYPLNQVKLRRFLSCFCNFQLHRIVWLGQ